ncbi:hypothetical protein HDV01_003325 [Terramyces sp. JEL0728]|nr:hypothetical protein HDV01_003325 [Terramyces sp. JEL0728]
MVEAFKVNLYKSHFTIQDNETTHQYHGPLKCLIDGINSLEIPPELSQYLGDHFETGRLKVQVTDYRYEPSITEKLYLKPTSESVLADVEQLKTGEWSLDFKNFIESQILVNTFQLNLNSSPSISVVNTQKEYNKRKYNLKRKRISNFDDKQVEETKRKESAKLMLLMDKSKDVDFYPRFSQLAFVEDWRQKQKMACEEQLIGLGDKNKIKINVQGISTRKVLQYNLNRKITVFIQF